MSSTQRTFIADDECEMPVAMQKRNHDLNVAAIECYELRNASQSPDDAQFFHDTGDIYLLRAIAITEEWE